MDQPYSRMADALLDYQDLGAERSTTSADDDTAWTMGELGNVEATRVTDVKILMRPSSWSKVTCKRRAP